MDELFIKLREMQKKAAFFLVALILLIVGAVIVFNFAGAFGFLFVAAAIPVGIMAVRTYKSYTTCFKENVVKTALGEVFSGLIFSPHDGMPERLIKNTGMMQMGNRYSSNDLIRGNYKGVNFMQSDVCIEEETTDSDGNTSTTTIFRGRWMIFDFNKEFRCDMQVISKRFSASKRKGGLFASKEEKTHKIEFENEEFNKAFRVYAQDEHEAFYLMTPHMMESLLDFRAKVNAPVMIAFIGGSLHIAINNHKDAFEAKLFGKLDPAVEKERILGDIRVITDFVDVTSIDRDIYKQ